MRIHVGGLFVAVLVLPLMLAPGAVGAVAPPAGVNITTVEGQAFSGTVVTGVICPLGSATIDWGDGTTSAGSSDNAGGIQGTHTYAEEGSYSASVSFSSDADPGAVVGDYTVQVSWGDGHSDTGVLNAVAGGSTYRTAMPTPAPAATRSRPWSPTPAGALPPPPPPHRSPRQRRRRRHHRPPALRWPGSLSLPTRRAPAC